jgi:phage tail sheath protein FI
MPVAYLHGAESQEVNVGGNPIKVTKSAVVGLVGTAPKGPVNTLTFVKNPKDAAQFGDLFVDDFTIPNALDALFQQGYGQILVVNVFDPANVTLTGNQLKTATAEAITLVASAGTLAHPPLLGSTNITVTNSAGSVTYAYGVDYVIHSGGAISLPGGSTITSTQSIKVTYKYAGTTADTIVLVAGAGATNAAPSKIVTVTDNPFTVTYVAGTDYVIDSYGNITLPSGSSITNTQDVIVTYYTYDSATVSVAQLTGTVNGTTNVKTGSKQFDLAYNLFGFKAKIYEAPGFSTTKSVADLLLVLANKFKGHALVDAPIGTSVPQMITARGTSGSPFNTGSERVILCGPHLKQLNTVTGDTILAPYSQFFAGVMCKTDVEEGYHASPSNHEIIGVLGAEYDMSFDITDPDTDVNALNEVGIVTVASSFGTGAFTWGNRSAAFPTSTAPNNFIANRRTADVVIESILLAQMPYFDKPLTPALIDVVRQAGNDFISVLIQRGALFQGSRVIFDPADNPANELALGHATWRIYFMSPTPTERMTFIAYIDPTLLTKVFAKA